MIPLTLSLFCKWMSVLHELHKCHSRLIWGTTPIPNMISWLANRCKILNSTHCISICQILMNTMPLKIAWRRNNSVCGKVCDILYSCKHGGLLFPHLLYGTSILMDNLSKKEIFIFIMKLKSGILRRAITFLIHNCCELLRFTYFLPYNISDKTLSFCTLIRWYQKTALGLSSIIALSVSIITRFIFLLYVASDRILAKLFCIDFKISHYMEHDGSPGDSCRY